MDLWVSRASINFCIFSNCARRDAGRRWPSTQQHLIHSSTWPLSTFVYVTLGRVSDCIHIYV